MRHRADRMGVHCVERDREYFSDVRAIVKWIDPTNIYSSRLTACGVSSRVSSRMLKKSASFVLAALRGSTYRTVCLASSLAAALLGDLFEHPAWPTPVASYVPVSEGLAYDNSFSAVC
jgi:hypothetical protein